MSKKNCWEFKKCGRELGGVNAHDMGVCPAAKVNSRTDGLNCGKHSGRICWAVAGTYCGGKIQGEFAQKQLTCMNCDFFKLVKSEEGAAFCLLIPGQVYKQATR